MALAPVQIQGLDEALSQQLGSFVKLQKVAAPFTTVVNRALVTDFSKDLMPKLGISRVMTQSLQEVQSESGPNGEKVFKVLNDIHDQVRLYGSSATSENSNQGLCVISYNMEITFYGTGLNVLIQADSGVRNLKSSIDGGALSAELYPSSGSSVLSGRNLATNQPLAIANGLALGFHTVLLSSSTSNIRFYGFEIINATATLQLSPGSSFLGGKKLSKSTLTTDAYNSNFESGTLGTKGGHVVVYQKSDGSIGKAVQPTDITQLNLTAASHTNEEIIRQHYFREFGSGRTDDFSLFLSGTATNLAFTLDDGTTTLAASQVRMSGTPADQSINAGAVGAYFTITFVGTGLDISLWSDTAGTSTVTVDGTSIGTLGLAGSSQNSLARTKIVSGLTYGTHIIKFTTAGANLSIGTFYIYGPKKPAIPAGSVELADYYNLATFAGATAGVYGSGNACSTGVISKSVMREIVYGGTWTTTLDPVARHGFLPASTATGSTFSYTFFGTGFDFGLTLSNSGVQLNVKVDGVNYTGAATATNTSTWTPGTSTFLVNSDDRLQVSTLALGAHTVTFTYVTGGVNIKPVYFDVITPIHSPKSNSPGDLQITLPVGSCALGDSRKFAGQQVKALSNWSQAVGVTSNPTTTSTVQIPAPDMTCIIKTSGNPIHIAYVTSASQTNTAAAVRMQIYVDGLAVGTIKSFDQPAGSGAEVLSDNLIMPVSAGVHTVQVFWQVSSGTGTLQNVWRNLNVREI